MSPVLKTTFTRPTFDFVIFFCFVNVKHALRVTRKKYQHAIKIITEIVLSKAFILIYGLKRPYNTRMQWHNNEYLKNTMLDMIVKYKFTTYNGTKQYCIFFTDQSKPKIFFRQICNIFIEIITYISKCHTNVNYDVIVTQRTKI